MRFNQFVMRRLVQLLFISITTGSLNAQGDSYSEKNNLQWNEFYKLRWADFQGTPGENAAGDAGTSVRIKAKPYLVKNKVKYDVYVIFNRDKSWKRDESPLLLAHEQLHFDLAEVYARKIRQKISDLSKEGVNDVKLYNREIQLLLEESNEADRQYDIETLHGVMDKKQAEWEKKVKEELNTLKNFKKPKNIIAKG
jgi:hypothetical protein